MIREATHEDKDYLLSLGRKFHAESQYSQKIDFDEESTWFSMCQLIDAGTLLVCEGGMIGFVMFPCFFNNNVAMAQEMFWYVDKDKRKSGLGIELLKRAEEVAKETGVKVFTMLCLESNRIDEMYSGLGYEKSETSFMRYL